MYLANSKIAKASPSPGNVRELENVVERDLILHTQGPLTFSNIQQNLEHASPSSFLDQENAIPNFDDLVSEYFRKVLKITNGKINGFRGAAELTGIRPNTLRNKMKKLQIPFGRKT